MTKEDLKNLLYMDEITYVGNPYFYIRDYEDKGVYVLLKKEKDMDLSYLDLQDVCFECPDMEIHEGVIKLVLFHVNEHDKIYKYSIASSKYKIVRSDILQYEKIIGQKVV